MIIYEPQIASWANQKQLIAYAAASYTVKGAATTDKPALGTLKIEADSRDPKLIQTVWGGGYRLAADVRRIAADRSC